MARRKGKRYSEAKKRAILDRVQAGETQSAIAADTGIPAVTIGYWLRKAQNSAPTNGRKRGRPRKDISRNEDIAYALEGDTLVLRIPLRSFARELAQKALAEI